MRLANSPWPRSGGDPANRSHVDLLGPSAGKILWECPLLQTPPATPIDAGVVVAEDGTARVTYQQRFFSITLGVGVQWEIPLEGRHSPPTALEDGDTLLSQGRSFFLFDEVGQLRARYKAYRTLDDSGISPCLTYHGDLVATSQMGDLVVLVGDTWKELGVFGYDLVPPAVFQDNSLAVSGYGRGYYRVGLDGQILWRTSLREADLTATIARSQCSAVGAVNDNRSEIYSPEGALLGQYSRAALFSEGLDGQWVALSGGRRSPSEGRLALLTPSGEELWGRDIAFQRGWGGLKAVTDQEGNIFCPCQKGLVSFSREGQERFFLSLGEGQPDALAVTQKGQIALLYQGRLLLVE